MTADIKNRYDRARVLALAESEGLLTAPNRIQCPRRCSDEKRGCAVGENGLWHCKRCDHGGSAIDLVMATRNLSMEESIEFLGQRLGTLPPPAPPRPAVDVPALWRSLSAVDVAGTDYLRGRGLEAAVTRNIVRFNVGGLGHSPAHGPQDRCERCWLDWAAASGYRLAMPLYSLDGALCSFQLRSIAPGVVPSDSKRSLAGVTYPAGGAVLGSPMQARASKRVFLTEGMADTLALLISGAAVIGAPGVDEVKKLPPFLGNASGRTIILCPQNDEARVAAGKHVRLKSETAFREIGDTLTEAGADVLTLHTPGTHKDPADWRKAIGDEAFKAELDSIQPLGDPEYENVPAGSGGAAPNLIAIRGTDPRPKILIRTDEHVTIDDSVAALRNDQHIFQRCGKLVHVVRDRSGEGRDGIKREPDAPRIELMPLAALRTRLTRNARFEKTLKTKNKRVPDHPPDWAVNGIHKLGTWPGIRAIDGITEAPVLRRDGSILDTPGYDPETRLLFEPSMEFLPVPSNPTRQELAAAIALLDEAVCDFPFEKDSHRAAWVAGLLSPLARPAFEGPIPLFAFDSNTPGAGKGKLCDFIAIVLTGRDMPRMPVPGNEEEWRKRILTVGLAGDPMVLLDNVLVRLGSQSLDAALTGGTWSDRVLGGVEMAKVPLRAVWYASGNNIQIKGDLFRRTVHSRLNSPHARPEERTDFKHRDLLGWAKQERASLLRAALTILRGYIAAGRPDQKLRAWGSFEAWSDLVRGAIVWVGLADPYETREGLAEAADEDTQILRRLVSAWEQQFGAEAFSIREVVKTFEDESRLAAMQKQTPKQPPLYDVFAELRPPIGGSFDAAKLGYLFRKFKGRVIDGKRLDCVTDCKGIAHWRVVTFTGTAGDPRGAANTLTPAAISSGGA